MIPAIGQRIQEEFANDGYQVSMGELSSGGCEVSITKGGLFKAILGMKSALKVTLTPRDNGIFFSATVGIFGQQIIPTVITMCIFWPVIITQVWGLIQQAKMDDRALEIVNTYILIHSNPSQPETNPTDLKYCTNCGEGNRRSARFCCQCGQPL